MNKKIITLSGKEQIHLVQENGRIACGLSSFSMINTMDALTCKTCKNILMRSEKNDINKK